MTTKRLAPMEVKQFGGGLQCILRHILSLEPRLGKFYLRKVYPSNAYMPL